MINDTICAIATGLTNSGISIIRVSGPLALETVDKIFINSKKEHSLLSMESHTLCYGFLLDGEEIIDEVIVSYFKGPKSFTAEDTVEINCHGGVFVTQKILDMTVNAGARLAEPGEFTKRAFLNGRIDLSSAEAVMDVISSESNASLKSSVSMLQGSLYKEIKNIRASILHEIAFIESALDDPEHFSTDGYNEKISLFVNELINMVSSLYNSYDNGRIIKDGIRTAIIGKPNAGKSSLLNTLSGFERAIVTDIPGTTRDAIEEKIRINDITLCLIDTAGIRDTEDIIEKIGVDKAKEYIDDSDLILWVIDSSVSFMDDEDFCSLLDNKKCIIIYNKTDLDQIADFEFINNKYSDFPIVSFSSKNDTGKEELYDVIKDMFMNSSNIYNNEIVISNIRHKEALKNTLDSLMLVKSSIEDDMPEDFYSIDLMNAYTSLGFIIGEEISDDLVNEIFSKFCMGK